MRVAVGVLALAALAFAVIAEVPADLPSVALEQELLYRGELLLVAFFGGLLIATPVLRGVVSGLLPTEITARGARYDAPEEITGGIEKAEQRIAQLEEVAEATSGQLAVLRARVRKLEGRGEAKLEDGER